MSGACRGGSRGSPARWAARAARRMHMRGVLDETAPAAPGDAHAGGRRLPRQLALVRSMAGARTATVRDALSQPVAGARPHALCAHRRRTCYACSWGGSTGCAAYFFDRAGRPARRPARSADAGLARRGRTARHRSGTCVSCRSRARPARGSRRPATRRNPASASRSAAPPASAVIAGATTKPRFSLGQHGRDVAHIGRGDRQPGRHRLQHRERHLLGVRRQREHVEPA